MEPSKPPPLRTNAVFGEVMAEFCHLLRIKPDLSSCHDWGSSKIFNYLAMMIKILITTLVLSGIGLADPSVEVITQDENSYQVTGRLWLSSEAALAGDTVRKAASCVNCRWHLQSICPDPSNQPVHLGFDCTKPASYSCSSGATRYQVWFLDTGLWRPSDWELRGTSCIGPAGPKSILKVQEEILDSATGFLPELILKVRPASKSLVNLPTQVKVTSPNTFSYETTVAGVVVLVTATATYRYDFQDGNSTTTTATEVNHVYRTRANYPIKVTASWQATWRTTMHGSNPVAGAQLTQVKSKLAEVVAARGRLIKR